MAYKIGYCPQCDGQIMVQDTNGRWNSFKPTFRQAYLLFDDGFRVKTTICSTCIENPDYQKLMDSIVSADSEACDEKTKNEIKFVKRKISPSAQEIEINGKKFREVTEQEDKFEIVERGLPAGIAVYNVRMRNGN